MGDPAWRTFPLLDALLQRRSRRFGRGMAMAGGPLAYKSELPPQPLSAEQEALLAFAACGITGHALAELPYQRPAEGGEGGGNVLTHLLGRTVPSGDAMHMVALFVLNDEGAWLLRRPQDVSPEEVPSVLALLEAERWEALYEHSRVRVSERRPELPRAVPFTPPFNQWSANVPGSTYFLPVAELSALYINILLAAFSEEMGYFVVDERNGYAPAGLGPFARSRGGHLHDDPKAGRVGTVGALDDWLFEFAAIEQGAMLQNLGLMAEALGLGGFAHFAAHPFGWLEALGFRMAPLPFSQIAGMGALMRRVVRWMGRDVPVPTALGLEREGTVLLKPFCPPYYPNMAAAVRAFVAYKFDAEQGTLRGGRPGHAWRDGASVPGAIPEYSERSIEATIAFCEYVYGRYGRIPASSGPFRTVLAYQAHRLDPHFYERYYTPSVGSAIST